MVSFRRTLFGYRRPEVDAAINARDAHIVGLEQHSAALADHNAALESQGLVQARAIASHEADVAALSSMVVERERTIRDLTGRLEEANACHDRSIASLDAVSARLEDLQSQARGQATRIRMKALREAVELTRRVEDLNEAEAADPAEGVGLPGAADPVESAGPARSTPASDPDDSLPDIAAEAAEVDRAAPQPFVNSASNGNGGAPSEPGTSWEPGLYEGKVRLEIGPLDDFSQLVGFEEAVGSLGATDVSVERFSEGRATFSMRLEEPVDLPRELESVSSLDFKVRHTAPGDLILDVDED